MARTGRPKKENVVRFPCGDIKEEIIPPPFNMSGVDEEVFRDETNREARRYQRLSALGRLRKLGVIDEHELEAGKKFHALWDRARRHYLDAPNPNPKIGSLDRGFGHEPDLSEEMIERGLRSKEAYDAAYKVIIECGVQVVTVIESVCFGDEVPWRLDYAKKGLSALARHFGLSNGRSRVA